MINIERAWSSLLSSSKKKAIHCVADFSRVFCNSIDWIRSMADSVGKSFLLPIVFFLVVFFIFPLLIEMGRQSRPAALRLRCGVFIFACRRLFVGVFCLFISLRPLCVCVCVCVCVDAVLSASVPVTHIHGGRRRNKGRRDAIMQKSVRLHAAAIPILIPLINRPAPHQKAPRHGRNNGAPRKVLPPPPRASSINDFGFANSPPTIEPEGRAWFLNFFFYLDHEIIHRKQGLEDFC